MSQLTDPSFGALRSALQQPPGEHAWERVCVALEASRRADPARYEEQHVPYAQGALRAWPPALRVAPERWYLREPSPLLAHARALTLEQRLSVNQVDALLTHPAIDALHTLTIPPKSYGEHALHRRVLPALTRAAPALHTLDADLMLATPVHLASLARLRCAGTLEQLRLRRAALGSLDGLRYLLDAPLERLRGLALRSCELDGHALYALAAAPWFSTLTSLELTGSPVGPALWDALRVAGPLTALSISGTQTNETILARILRADALTSLTSLDISSNPLDHAGLRALPRASFISRLRRLNLSHLHLRPIVSTLIEAAPALTELDLSSCNGGDSCDEPLSRLIAQLTTLTLGEVRVGAWLPLTMRACLHERMESLYVQCDQLWRALVEQPARQLPALRQLALPRCALGSHGLRALLGCEMPALGALRLDHNEIGALDGFARARLPALHTLDLSSNPLNSAEPRHLKALPPSLLTLKLSGCQLTTRQLAALLDAPLALRHLDLSSNGFGDEGLALISAASLPHLHTLDLSSCQLSAPAIAELISSPALPHLHTLDIAYNRLSDQHTAQLDQLARLRGLTLKLSK